MTLYEAMEEYARELEEDGRVSYARIIELEVRRLKK